MKKTYKILILLLGCILFLVSCHRIVGNSIELGYLESAEGYGTEIAYVYGDMYKIDNESKTYSVIQLNEDELLSSEPDNVLSSHVKTFFGMEIPEGYEEIEKHIEACAIEDREESVVYAYGSAKDGVLRGIVQVYYDSVGYLSGGGCYGIEEISHSLIFTYYKDTDSFVEEYVIDGAVAVAAFDGAAIIWRDKAFYLYDTKSREEEMLVEHLSYDVGPMFHSYTNVYSSDRYALLYMCVGSYEPETYLYIYDNLSRELCELEYVE